MPSPDSPPIPAPALMTRGNTRYPAAWFRNTSAPFTCSLNTCSAWFELLSMLLAVLAQPERMPRTPKIRNERNNILFIMKLISPLIRRIRPAYAQEYSEAATLSPYRTYQSTRPCRPVAPTRVAPHARADPGHHNDA